MKLALNAIQIVVMVLTISIPGTAVDNPKKYTSFDDWTVIESLAEEHPYIVGLLNYTKNYTCSGVIVDHRAVLTSGACIRPEPAYVAVGSAIAGQRTNNNNIFKIAFSRAHEDYIFEVYPRSHNITRMHSNIALVFTEQPILLYFTESAILGNYFESELRDKKISSTGYGKLSTNNVTVLQRQVFLQAGCTNPKWYYCICGIESSIELTYDISFGEGAPAFYGDEVIGISAFPSGVLRLKGDVRYNVFTVIGPYLPWIKKTLAKPTRVLRSRAENFNKIIYFNNIVLLCIKIFLQKFYME